MKSTLMLLASAALLTACNAETEEVVAPDTGEAATEQGPVLAERTLDDVPEVTDDIDEQLAAGGPEIRRDDLTMPVEARYATIYLGSYAPSGQCGRGGNVLELASQTVSWDGVTCEVENITGSGNRIAIDASSCRGEGGAVADRTFRVNLTAANKLAVSGAASGTFDRCAAAAPS